MTYPKKTLAASLTAAIAATLLSAAPASAATVVEYPKSMAALGDSMTQAATSDATKTVTANGTPGYSGPTGNAPLNSWSTGSGTKVNSHYNRIKTATGSSLVAYNDSKSGSKAADLLRQATLAADQNVEYVTILSGANDVCGASSIATLPSVATYKNNVRAALTKLQSSSANPDVLLASVPSLMKLYEIGKNDPNARYAWALGNTCSIMLGSPQDVSDTANARRAAVEKRVQDMNLALTEVCSEFSKCKSDEGAVSRIDFTIDDISIDYFHANVSGQNKISAATWEIAEKGLFTNVTADPINTKPFIAGADNVTVIQKGAFNPTAGITASDVEDGDLTSKITSTGSVDTAIPGTYTVTYSVTDSKGETVTVDRVVTVEANNAPTIAGTDNVTVVQGSAFNTTAGVTASDTEDGDLTSRIIVAGAVDINATGTYTVNYTVSDSKGETSTVQRTVTVVANNAPTITGVSSVTVGVNTVFNATAGVTASDVEDGDLTSRITTSGTVNTAVAGVYTVSYSVVDSKNATTTATRTVTVKANTKPSIVGARSVTISQWSDFNTAAGVTATDVEDGSLTSKLIIAGNVDTTVPGVYRVTYSVTDSVGAVTSYTRTITVVANDKPVIAGVSDTTIPQFATFSIRDGITASDPQDGDLTSKITTTGTVNAAVAGTYTVKYSVKDSKGLTVTASRVVTVTPNSRPTITGARSATISQWSDFSATKNVTAADTQDGNLTDSLVVTGEVNTAVPGTYVLKYSVKDSSGVTATATRTITVVANDKPVLTGVANTTIAQHSTFNVRDGITASDRQDGNLTSAITVTGTVNAAVSGTYTVNYSVKDSKGLTVTASRVVTVTPNSKPTITGAASTTIGQWYEFDANKGVVANDAEDGDLTSQITTSGAVNATVPGKYVVKYSVKDSSGVTVVATRTVTVLANDKPVITAADHSVKAGTVYRGSTYATAYDAQDGNITTRVTNITTVNTAVRGTYTTTYTVTDSKKVTVTKTVNVTVY